MKKILLLSYAALLLAAPLPAQAPVETAAQHDSRMQWWRDGKFGMFIHYGLYSGLAGELEGKKYDGAAEWIQAHSGADFDTYKREAMPRFTPRSGMADEWVSLAKEAGCTYVVLTSRHHEGFNLFETPGYDFNAKTCNGIDVVDEYVAACEKYGLKTGLYFSIIDWNHPDYDPTGSGISYPKGNLEAAARGERQFGNHDRYKDYLLTTFRQLLDSHRVDLIWWDFSQPTFEGDAAWGASRLMKALFDKYPMAIQNNRLYASNNLQHDGVMQPTPLWKGDYTTPEHYIPPTGIDGDWEVCQTLNGTWGYSADNDRWKSLDELIRELVDVVSRGGNFLLNIGPMADGTVPAESVRLFRGIGAWMAANGEAVYGTRANPFDSEFAWGRVTRKGPDTLYLFLYAQPEGGIIELPATFAAEPAATRLTDGMPLRIEQDPTTGICRIDVSSLTIDSPAVVVKLSGTMNAAE